jgi:hypothetical protein
VGKRASGAEVGHADRRHHRVPLEADHIAVVRVRGGEIGDVEVDVPDIGAVGYVGIRSAVAKRRERRVDVQRLRAAAPAALAVVHHQAAGRLVDRAEALRRLERQLEHDPVGVVGVRRLREDVVGRRLRHAGSGKPDERRGEGNLVGEMDGNVIEAGGPTRRRAGGSLVQDDQVALSRPEVQRMVVASPLVQADRVAPESYGPVEVGHVQMHGAVGDSVARRPSRAEFACSPVSVSSHHL